MNDPAVCLKCKGVGGPITRLSTYAGEDRYYYAVSHRCDIYPFPEAREYLHGNLAVRGTVETELFDTPEAAWEAWDAMNAPRLITRLLRRIFK